MKNKPVVPVNAEARLLHGLSRLSPAVVRLLARVPAPRLG